ncbi:MAG: nucleotidyltransferase domain-containing protein [Clostridia bacterium]|nr:nucleotidyltransferase domain-containing protein [Clostridia bacterium]
MDKIKNIIYETLKELNLSVAKILLFGSRATENYRPDSDYDILVVINEDIENDLKIKISCAITRRLADIWIDADIIVKSNSELDEYKNRIGSIVRVALNEGVLV